MEAETVAEARVPLRRAIIDPRTDPRWLQLVSENSTDVFHSPQWLAALSRTYGFELQAAVAVDTTGRPVAGLPYCVVEGPPAKRIAAPPFSDYCDPIVATAAQWELLIDPLLSQNCTVTIRSLHNPIPTGDERLATVNRAKWHGLDISPEVDSLWSGIDSSARRAIRKAEKEGVVVRQATDKADLRAFFDLHLATRKYKYRLLAQPYAFFENLWDEYVAKDGGSLLLAIHQGEVIGGVFFLEWRGGLYYKFSASLAGAVSLRPNDLIIWTGVQTAKSKGLERLDFGLSDWEQEGLVRYKRKYASEEKTITFLRNKLDQPASVEAVQTREILSKLTDLLTADAVPDGVTERAGDILYRLFA